MIICSNCKNQEMMGALFCSECGVQLDLSAGSSTDAFESPFEAEDVVPEQAEAIPVVDSRVTLYLLAFDATIQLNEVKEYSLGRVSEGQKALPDIDLSDYKGFENGVSRLHASITVADDHVIVKDLGSSNGSLLNEKKMVPHVPYPIENGDMLIFGKLIARVLVK